MQEGEYQFFVIQHRKTHQSPWLKREPLEPVDDEWHMSSWEFIGHCVDPWKNDKPIYTESYNEVYDVWRHTGDRGWWTLKLARQAIKRLQKASQEGKLDMLDGYRKHCQSARYEFRIVKINLAYKEEVVEIDSRRKRRDSQSSCDNLRGHKLRYL